MRKKWPSISLILPTFNEEKRLKDCLNSIKRQKYPPKKIELIIIDDESTDKTVEIAKSFGAKIFRNGSHNCERGRSIGLKKAKGDLVLIIDADNILPFSDWLERFAQPFLENPDLVGAQTGWYEYEKRSSPFNRYCALFGASKPLSFYLKKRNFLMATEKKWIYPQTLIEEKKNYFLVRFTTNNLPTLGSQGFLGKRKLLLKTNFKPFYFHMDSLYELVAEGHNLFAIIKTGIIHRHTDSFWLFHQKFYRDISRFFYQQGLRKYLYQTNKMRQAWAVLASLSFIIPLIDSLKGFLKKRDWVWFLHPFLCQTTLWLSFWAFLEWKLGFRNKFISKEIK